MTGSPVGDAAELSSLDALADELSEQGLEVVILRGGLLAVKNPAECSEEASVATKMSNSLSQTVACRRGADGRLWWYWVWSGPTRDSAPDFEPLCPAEQVALAAARVARVLALRQHEEE